MIHGNGCRERHRASPGEFWYRTSGVSAECPALLAVGGSQHDEYISKAQEWYDKLSKI
jgi:hypothetical protein